MSPSRRSSSSETRIWASRGLPAASRSARHCARNEVLPPLRTPMTAKALPGMPGRRTSRRVRAGTSAASDSSSFRRRRSWDIVIFERTRYAMFVLPPRTMTPGAGGAWPNPEGASKAAPERSRFVGEGSPSQPLSAKKSRDAEALIAPEDLRCAPPIANRSSPLVRASEHR